MIVKCLQVRCDVCGQLSPPEPKAVLARRQAKAEGWSYRRPNRVSKIRIDLCPDCQNEVG